MIAKLTFDFNERNKRGDVVAVHKIKIDPRFRNGVGVLVSLNGRKKQTWMTISWICKEPKAKK